MKDSYEKDPFAEYDKQREELDEQKNKVKDKKDDNEALQNAIIQKQNYRKTLQEQPYSQKERRQINNRRLGVAGDFVNTILLLYFMGVLALTVYLFMIDRRDLAILTVGLGFGLFFAILIGVMIVKKKNNFDE